MRRQERSWICGHPRADPWSITVHLHSSVSLLDLSIQRGEKDFKLCLIPLELNMHEQELRTQMFRKVSADHNSLFNTWTGVTLFSSKLRSPLLVIFCFKTDSISSA